MRSLNVWIATFAIALLLGMSFAQAQTGIGTLPFPGAGNPHNGPTMMEIGGGFNTVDPSAPDGTIAATEYDGIYQCTHDTSTDPPTIRCFCNASSIHSCHGRLVMNPHRPFGTYVTDGEGGWGCDSAPSDCLVIITY